MAAQHSTDAHPWRAIALTWPVDHHGIATSRKLIAGTFATYGEALAAAKAKVEEIGGVGFTAEQHVTS
mgnify:CR=1 FL=1